MWSERALQNHAGLSKEEEARRASSTSQARLVSEHLQSVEPPAVDVHSGSNGVSCQGKALATTTLMSPPAKPRP